jgi:hypothetical protein
MRNLLDPLSTANRTDAGRFACPNNLLINFWLGNLRLLWTVIIFSAPFFFCGLAKGADILQAATGGASGTDWNQGSQWTGGEAPTTGNNYVLYTNTSNNSTLSSYYGVGFGTGYIRTPVNGSASVFLGDSVTVPPGTEILLKESNGGSANANIIFKNYNNINSTGLFPLVRLGPNTSGGNATLNGTISNLCDSYVANDAGAAMTLTIASTVVGASNLTFVSSSASGSSFSSTRTNLVTGDWSGFTGTLNIGNSTVAAMVELNNSAVNVNLALVMPRANAILRLDKGISVKSFSITNNPVAAGTYTPAQLAALGFGGTFFGSGSLTVGFTAPPSLTATSGNAQVALSWQAVYGAVSYNVKRSTSSGAELTLTNVTGTSWANVGLVNGTTYYYTVSGVDGGRNESGDSAEVSAIPNGTVTSPRILKVYLQAGQSNSDGRAVTNGLSLNVLNPQNDVLFYYYLTGSAANGDGTLGRLTTLRPGASALGGGTTFGPELTFGRTLADYYALSNGVGTSTVMIAIIKYAHGGTSLISDWAANGTSSSNGDGPDYVIFQQVVSAGLSRLAAAYPDARQELDGMIWVQGESDIDGGSSASAAYGTNLVKFINDVRLTYATNLPSGANLPFFFSRISANQTVYSNPADPDYPRYLVLRAGQQYATTNLSNVFMIDTDPPQFSAATPWSGPGLHFDTQGQQSLGIKFGQAAIKSLPPPQLQMPDQQGTSWRLHFTGVSGTTHSIARANSISGPWTVLTNIVVEPAGVVTYDDLSPLYPSGFYRLSRP